MQETRLNLLIQQFFQFFRDFLANPWRKLSVILICLLLGFFLAGTISTTVGQNATWDVSVALIFLLCTETISFFVYSRNRSDNSKSGREIINALKMGFMYGLYLEALKLGS